MKLYKVNYYYEKKKIYQWRKRLFKNRFNKYIKGKKDKKYDTELINVLVTYLECSKLEAKENLSFISKEEVNQILEKYGFDPKKIKSICKRNFKKNS